jgi:hypothetical protein
VIHPGVTNGQRRDVEGAQHQPDQGVDAMYDQTSPSRPRSRRFRAFASVIGPVEVAALAGTVRFLETDELARIALTAVPADPRSPR